MGFDSKDLESYRPQTYNLMDDLIHNHQTELTVVDTKNFFVIAVL